MFDVKTVSLEWGGKTLTLETGRIARQADGAVIRRLFLDGKRLRKACRQLFDERISQRRAIGYDQREQLFLLSIASRKRPQIDFGRS